MSDLWGNSDEQTGVAAVGVADAGVSQDNTAVSMELMNDMSVQQNSHTAVHFSEQELATLKYQIEQEIRSAQMNPNFSQADAQRLAAEMSVGTGIDPNLASTMGAEAFRTSQSAEDFMNTNADGSKNVQANNEQNQSSMWSFSGAFAGLAAMGAAGKESLMSVIDTVKGWIMTDREQGTNVSLAELGELSPNGPKAQRGIEGRGL